MERWKAAVEEKIDNFLTSNFSNKTVLVTGHTGFKGSWLTALLLELGANVCGISSANVKNTEHFESLNFRIPSYRFDISEQDRFKETFNNINPDMVFHLAAQPLVRYSYAFPRETWETNVLGTLNLLESLRLSEKRIPTLIITSDKCYRNENKEHVFVENDPLGGDDPYSSSKAAVEILVHSYMKSFLNLESNKGPIATARAGNIVGGGDWSEDRLIPDIIKATTLGSSLVLRNPSATRPWMYILDVLTGYLKLMSLMVEKGDEFSGSWNFGPSSSETVSVSDIVALWGVKFEVPLSNSFVLPEKSYLMLDSSKSRELLHWNPILSLADSINLTKNWYSAYYAGNETQTITEIQRYLAILATQEGDF